MKKKLASCQRPSLAESSTMIDTHFVLEKAQVRYEVYALAAGEKDKGSFICNNAVDVKRRLKFLLCNLKK